VLETLAAQPQRSGLRLTILPVDADGRITADDVEAALTSDTSLVSVGWANNEIGTIQPVTEIAAVCRRRGVPLHSDAVQAAGKIATPAGDVDLVSLSAHKLGGPKGVGALRVRTGLSLAALLRGGSQERSRRAGTENVAGIVGFGVACELAAGRVAAAARLESLRERLWRGLADLGAVKRNSPGTGCLPNTLNVSLLRQSGDAAVAVLDLAGVAVSTGSACAAGAAEPSHVLLALGRDPQLARDALRFSLGPETSDQNIDAALRVLSTVLSVPASAFARE
jgi:cysteine desulfurase